MKANIKTISELTGFSQATVSNVLNNKKNVKKSTADLIIQTAQRVGYLNSYKIDNVQIVMYKKSGEILTETPLINELIEGVESEARNNQLPTIVCTLKESDMDFEKKMEEILYSRNSGIILLATEMEWEDLKRFEGIKDRMVVVDAHFREGIFDSLLMDNMDSFYKSVLYLYEKGHRSICMLDSSIEIRNFTYRRLGFTCAMADLQIPCGEHTYIKLHPTMTGAYQDMLRYLESKPKLPSAFCAINDIIAIGAMKAIQEFGYRIPDDISIMGFDNMPYGDMTSPRLTTVNILKREMGELAVQKLLQRCNHHCHVQSITQLHTTILERESVKEVKFRMN